jgi:O-acetyl-ADP-ribose deacetylase (regulator of RNase III)
VATSGGRLAVGRVFHVAVHEPARAAEPGPLRRGIENAVQQARKAGAETLAVPLGGLRGMPPAQAAPVVVEAVLRQRRAFSEIVFVVLERGSERAARAAVEQAVRAVAPAAHGEK